MCDVFFYATISSFIREAQEVRFGNAIERWGRFQSIILVSFIWRSLNVCPSPTYSWEIPTTNNKKDFHEGIDYDPLFVPGFNFQGEIPSVQGVFLKLIYRGHWKMDDWNMEDTKTCISASQQFKKCTYIRSIELNCGYQPFVHEMFKICSTCFRLCFPIIAYQRFRGIDLEYLEPFLDVDQHDSNCLHDWIWMCRSFFWKVPSLWFLKW